MITSFHLLRPWRVLALGLVLLLTGPLAQAQVVAVPPATPPPGAPPLPQKDTLEMANPKFILSLYPLAFIGGHFMLGGELGLSRKFGLRLNGAVGVAESSNYYSHYGNDVRDMTAYYVELQGRYYPLGKGVQGLYIGPYTYFKGMNFTSTTYDPLTGLGREAPAQVQALGMGVIVGYNVLFWRNTVSVDAYLGGGPNLPNGDNELIDENVIDSYSRSMVWHAGFNIGVRIK